MWRHATRTVSSPGRCSLTWRFDLQHFEREYAGMFTCNPNIRERYGFKGLRTSFTRNAIRPQKGILANSALSGGLDDLRAHYLAYNSKSTVHVLR